MTDSLQSGEMRAVLLLLATVAVAGCSSPTPRSASPTPDVEGTVRVRVATTVATVSTSVPAVQATRVPPTLAPTSLPTPTVKPAPEPVTRSGKGILKTDPFELGAGNYEIHWQAIAPPNSPCYHGGSLTALAAGIAPQLIANASVPAGQTQEGSTHAYNLKAGQYYLNMSSGCEWTVAIIPA